MKYTTEKIEIEKESPRFGSPKSHTLFDHIECDKCGEKFTGTRTDAHHNMKMHWDAKHAIQKTDWRKCKDSYGNIRFYRNDGSRPKTTIRTAFGRIQAGTVI